jgi:hypothetical protein
MIYNYEIVPFEGVGPFKFGLNISEYTTLYNFERLNKVNSNEFDSYLFKGETGDFEVSVDEGGSVSVITCCDKCIYNGYDLILMNIDTFLDSIKISKKDLKMEEIHINDDKTMNVYDVKEVGFQLWVNSKNVIEIVDVFSE